MGDIERFPLEKRKPKLTSQELAWIVYAEGIDESVEENIFEIAGPIVYESKKIIILGPQKDPKGFKVYNVLYFADESQTAVKELDGILGENKQNDSAIAVKFLNRFKECGVVLEDALVCTQRFKFACEEQQVEEEVEPQRLSEEEAMEILRQDMGEVFTVH